MKDNNLTKSQLVRNVADRFPQLFIRQVQDVMDIVLDEISESLTQSHRVELRGFGTFSVRKRAPRTARNPRTSTPVNLDSRQAPYFRAGKELRDKLNA
jgi:integration host factor subunit beta